MTYYCEKFVPSGCSFDDRIGAPEEYDAAVGRVVLGRGFLVHEVNRALKLMGIDLYPKGFDDRIAALGAVVRRRAADGIFNAGDEDPIEAFEDLAGGCRQAWRLCQRVVDPDAGVAITAKYPDAARAPKRKITPVDTDPDYVLDIYDYAVSTGVLVEEFFLTVPGAWPRH